VAGDAHLPLVAAGERGEGVDGGALARSVGAEQCVDGAGFDLEVEPVERQGVAVPLAQPAGDQGWDRHDGLLFRTAYG
jgi:hypothetical protein